jgi:purine nucleosidase/pyrimidine-specific ribonucleoside hydrolase
VALMTTPVLIDCDPGHDDAMALLLALASPELELLGVTTVHGNQTLEKTTANALRVLEFAGFGDVPVAAGADRPLMREARVAAHVHGETGLDGPDLPPPAGAPVSAHAVDFLADRLRMASGPVTLIPTGPLTNIALLLAHHPDVAGDIERIVLMGGSIAEGNVTPAAEFNIWVDPEAAARVFASGLDVTMVGLDVTHRALMTPEHAERLEAAGRVGTMVAELWAFYHRWHTRIYEFPGTPVHDALAVAHVIDGALMTTARRNVEVDCASELCRGRTVVDLWQISGREPNAHGGVEVKGAAFLDLLVERIGSLG